MESYFMEKIKVLFLKSINVLREQGIRAFCNKAKRKLNKYWCYIDLKNRAPKGIIYIKEYGFRSFLRKTKMVLLKKPNYSTIIPTGRVRKLSDIPMSQFNNKKIAIQLHLYYTDLADEFIEYFNHIPFKFDLFISVQKGVHTESIKSHFQPLKNVDNVVVRQTENRGRDISPIYVLFRNELQNYDYIAHVHSKKSLYSGRERTGWRTYALESIMGSEDIVRKILYLFENEKVGIVAPETYEDVPMIAHTWMSNVPKAVRFLSEIGIPYSGGYFNYPVGSFFWAKVEAIRPLFDRGLQYSDFDEEKGQTDNTLAHVLERAIAKVAEYRGYHQAFVDREEDNIVIGHSTKYLRPYSFATKEWLCEYLAEYDLVTFDIFDTLITRKLLHPDDLFILIKEKIKKNYGFDLDFLKIRKQAEAEAWNKQGAYCNIHHIYEEMKCINTGMPSEIIDEIKELEIRFEKELVIPRKDMLCVFNYLKEKQIRIMLISDMYLPQGIVTELLAKCGYSGWEELWVSCDKGKRKDNGALWDEFFNEFGKLNTIHVGDNPHSDCQMLLDRKRDSFALLSSYDEFKLSPWFGILSKYDTHSAENSFILGSVLNGGVFNSPFMLDTRKHSPEMNASTLGYIWFGPLCLKFVQWLVENAEKNRCYLFLAREGYLLERVFKAYCDAANIAGIPNEYFLASRRAASVAGICEEADVHGIVDQVYEGSADNFFRARFGLTKHEDFQLDRIVLPRDIDTIMKYLKAHRDELKEHVAYEKDNYLKYIQSIKEKWNVNAFSVVDVGYSGTIQYYLCKLMEEKVDGFYLITQPNKKPERLGAECRAIYAFDTLEEMEKSEFFNMQLFLEGGFKAPYGQLLYFDSFGEGVKPVFKNDDKVDEYITEFQTGIIEFAEDFGRIVGVGNQIETGLPRDVYVIVPQMGCIDQKVSNAFQVQDDYCSNGNLMYDQETGRWHSQAV